jgi:hypothetical protein
MGPRPLGYELERIDNDGNYCKENCRWATHKDQNRNTTRNRMITYKGKTQCLSAWSEDTGIPESTLRTRLDKLNWDKERTLETPINKSFKKKK